ncbi:hypothetical protein Bbelb_364540 [Branchiostoma belcheri]|nr:hypothetical protein Bbelb_364540 [Branchiostoma belcheri]
MLPHKREVEARMTRGRVTGDERMGLTRGSMVTVPSVRRQKVEILFFTSSEESPIFCLCTDKTNNVQIKVLNGNYAAPDVLLRDDCVCKMSSDPVHLKEAPRSKSSPQNDAPGSKHRRHVEHKEDTEDTFAVSQCATTSLPTTTKKRRTLRFLRVVQAPQVAEKPELQARATSQSKKNSQGRRLHFEEDGFLFIFGLV